MLNKILLVGNLTKDPEIRYTGTGKAVCNMRLASTREFTTKEGGTKKDTLFITAVVWGKMAEICSKELHKGSGVFVEGHLTLRSWKPDQSDKEVSVIELQVGTVQFLERIQKSVTEESPER